MSNNSQSETNDQTLSPPAARPRAPSISVSTTGDDHVPGDGMSPATKRPSGFQRTPSGHSITRTLSGRRSPVSVSYGEPGATASQDQNSSRGEGLLGITIVRSRSNSQDGWAEETRPSPNSPHGSQPPSPRLGPEMVKTTKGSDQELRRDPKRSPRPSVSGGSRP
jgi:hypothetical protein